MTIPDTTAWTEYEEAVDEQTFTPWAQKGWLAHNGQSPEIAVCDFVSKLIRMMQPQLVIETGVGQGYMTRTVAVALEGVGQLAAFESDDDWRNMMSQHHFWTDYRNVTLSPLFTPPAELLSIADLTILDSDFPERYDEIVLWHGCAKDRAAALIHDTQDVEGTSHQTMRELIQELGMTGVFLNNPRGCFLAVQPAKEN